MHNFEINISIYASVQIWVQTQCCKNVKVTAGVKKKNLKEWVNLKVTEFNHDRWTILKSQT